MGRHSGPLREKYEQALSAIHDNFNILCAIDIKTTGPLPGHDSLYEICVLPIGSYMEPYEHIVPFYTTIQPFRLDNIHSKIKNKNDIGKAITSGMDYGMSIDTFEQWFNELPLNLGKKIMPLAYNWPLTYSFLIDWLGVKHCHHYFDYRFRDILSMAHFVNDYADFHIRTYPFKKIDYSYILNVCNVEHNTRNTDTLENCMNITQVYRDTLRDTLLALPKFDSGTLEDSEIQDPEMIPNL